MDPLPIHASDEPVRAFSRAQDEVVDLLSKGWSYGAIARQMGVSIRTVHHIVEVVEGLIPYPREEQVGRREHVMLWAVHRVWHRYMKAAGRVSESSRK